MDKIQTLLQESTYTQSNSVGRPTLVSLTRATTKLIFNGLVAQQKTNKPVAALFGVKYLNDNGDLSFQTGATYSGDVTTQDRKTLVTLTLANKDTITKNQIFLYQDVAFKALVDNPFNGSAETELPDLISEAVAALTIRLYADSAPTEKYESKDVEISNARFKIDKWQCPVRTRKLKTGLTTELAQDVEASSFDAPNLIEDVLATQMAEEVNKHIVQSLITVSRRFKVNGLTDKGVLDLSGVDTSPEQGRRLYRMICEMNADIQRNTSYTGTYVLASTRAAAVLSASGWVKDIEEDYDENNAIGRLKNGLLLYVDTNSPIDYAIVGVTGNYGEMETIGSLFYAPYTEGLDLDDPEHVGMFKIINDPNSLQPEVMLMIRYALSVNPYTVGLSDDEARVIESDNFDNLAGRSLMSTMIGIKLPKLVE